jgi:hypothetical protein
MIGTANEADQKQRKLGGHLVLACYFAALRSPKLARPICSSSHTYFMTRSSMNIQDATVHGFRSSFRDWAGNLSNFPVK